jgi:hypothetical protein
MKTFAVELKRVSFVTITVEAGSTEEAECAAWTELDNHNDKYADWEIESIEEITK